MRLTRLVHMFTPIGMATIVAGTLAVAPAVTASASGQDVTVASNTGSTNLTALAGPLKDAGFDPATEISHGKLPNSFGALSKGATANPPDPVGSAITTKTSATGFDGLDHRDQRFAGTGAYANTQFSLEPPDQGLCVGNGFVVETVNTAIQVYDTSGHALMPGAVAINQFFERTPEVIRSTPPVFGDFTSDPKCLFDATTNRFFLTVLEIDVDSKTGAFGGGGGRSQLLIAVTSTGNPTGTWNLFSVDTTDDGTKGTPSHAACPCFGDQPLIGTDRNGFFVSTNEFPIVASGFNGAQIYAMSKRALARGVAPNVVHLDIGPIPVPPPDLALKGIWFSLQPAVAPTAAHSRDFRSSEEESRGRGTEYFLGALDFSSTLDNRIVLFTLTNTRSLNTSAPSLTLTHAVISTETYGQPLPNSPTSGGATQKDGGPGSRPLGELLGEPLNTLNANDDRMNQVVLADGRLWSAVNTIIGSGASARDGIAWFSVDPNTRDGGSLEEDQQGYVSLANDNVLFPSIGVGKAGPIMTFTVSGPNYFPSAAFKRLQDDSPIQIVGNGTLPADGFTGYAAFGGSGFQRWGDYSAAVTASDGTVWLATEYINTSVARPRTFFTNWGTFIMHVGSEQDNNN